MILKIESKRMKNKIIIVILIMVFNQACVEKPRRIASDSIDIRKELGFAEISIPKKSQLKKSYFNENYFCYGHLDLFENSTFWEASTCEGHLYFSIGNWKVKHDSIILNYTPLNKLNLIIDYSIKGDTSKFFVLKITNQDHEPIKGFLIKGFKKGVPTESALKFGSLDTDEQGEVKIRKADFDSVMIYAFKCITDKVFTLKNELLPDTMKLTLFYNGQNFFRFPTYEFKRNDSVFIIKNKQLIANGYVLKEVKTKIDKTTKRQ